jgi:phosphoglycerate dehydrogenase-like enzyme
MLVNIARGGLIDESAMLDVLNTGRLDYAVLDVFRTEPLPDDHPFWDHERVLMGAHTASAGSDRPARGDQLIENLEN